MTITIIFAIILWIGLFAISYFKNPYPDYVKDPTIRRKLIDDLETLEKKYFNESHVIGFCHYLNRVHRRNFNSYTFTKGFIHHMKFGKKKKLYKVYGLKMMRKGENF